MNRIITSILVCSICANASAAIVSIPDAGVIANRFFGSNRNLIPISSCTLLGENSEEVVPTFYVINNPSGGWLILSAEDSATPVLAYSRTGAFPTGNICPSTLEWMRGINTGIEELRTSHATPCNIVRAQWENIGIRTKAGSGEVLLETADWGQKEPYNNLCPQVEGQTCVTGCVATAIAIVCRYHKWPAKGNGTTTSYTTDTKKITISGKDFSTHTYNWDDMPVVYDESWTSKQKSAVASLMYDIGVMVQMDYTPTSSGASSTEIMNTLKNHLSYSKKAREVFCKYMDPNEWFNILKDEIDASRPTIYSATTDDNKNGHAFVCDGYNANRMIHINWGWSGKGNGFFATTWLGDGETTGIVFNGYQESIIGISPDRSEEFATSAANLFLWSQDSMSGIMLKSGTPSCGNPFVLDIGWIGNGSADTDYSGEIKAVLIDKDFSVKEDISDASSLAIKKMTEKGEITGTVVTDVRCTITGAVSPADAIAIMYSQPDGSWARIGGDQSSGTISLMGVYDSCFIGNSATYSSGDCIYPSIIQGHKAVKEIKWYYDGDAMEKGFITAESGEHKLKAVVTFADGYTETVIHPFKVN